MSRQDTEFTINNTVRTHSHIYFNTPSDWARENLLYVQMYGSFVCDERYHIERDGFASCLLILTHAGQGVLEMDGKKYICAKSTLTLIDCSKPHKYHADGHWEFLWLHFYGKNAKELVTRLLSVQGPTAHIDQTSLVYRFFQILIADGCTCLLENEMRNASYIQFFLSEMMKERRSNGSPRQTLVNSAIGYIESHYRETISVEDIARYLSLSRSAFYQAFRQETGSSPYDFILNKRLNRAKELLKTTPATISAICEEIGFNSEANFIKTFRAKTGMTPRKFRYYDNAPLDMGTLSSDK